MANQPTSPPDPLDLGFIEARYAQVYAVAILDQLLYRMQCDPDRQALIQFAEALHPGAYAQYLADRALLARTREALK